MFNPNDYVQIVNTNRKTLNGQYGTVLKETCRKGWYTVRLDTTRKRYNLRAANLFFAVPDSLENDEAGAAFVDLLEADECLFITEEGRKLARQLGISTQCTDNSCLLCLDLPNCN